MEPLPQLRGRGYSLGPQVVMESFFRLASRPEPIGINAETVFRRHPRRVIINPFDFYLCHVKRTPRSVWQFRKNCITLRADNTEN